MSEVYVWHNPESNEVWVTDGKNKVKVEPLVLEGMRMLHDKERKRFEREIDRLRSSNRRLRMLLADIQPATEPEAENDSSD